MVEPATRAALVVAAYEFEDPKFQRLRSPVQDVDALAGVLGDAGIGGFDITTIVNETSAVVQQELERFFSGRKPDDLLLLYFSCHGVKDTTGRLYFATTNTTFDLLRSTGVAASFVSEQMEYSPSKRIIVLLDCCYSGAFLKGFRARGDDSVAVDQLEGRGRAVITASRATEYAFEADELMSENAQPSMFTGSIVEGLDTGRADVNGDGFVTVDELYDYVYDSVRSKVAGQTPGRWMDVEGELVIARNPKAIEKAAITSTDAPSELPPPLEPERVPEEEPIIVGRAGMVAGVLAAIAGVAVLASPYFAYLRYDGYSDSLADRKWYSIGTFVVFGLAAWAAYSLLRTRRGQPTGLAVLLGMLPVAASYGTIVVADLVHGESNGPGLGLVLALLGYVLLVVAGVLAALVAPMVFTVSPPRVAHRSDLRRTVTVVAALFIGLLTSCGWGVSVGVKDGGLFGVAAPAQSLAIRLMMVSALLCGAWTWLMARHIRPALLVAGAVVLFGALVAAFLSTDLVRNSDSASFFVAFAVFAVGAAIMPLASTVLMPSAHGANMLIAWVATAAAFVPTGPPRDVDVSVLAVGLVAAGALAVVLRLSNAPADSGLGRLSPAHG